RDRLRDVRLPLAGAVPPRARDALGRPAVAPSALRSLRRGAGAAGRRGVLRRLRAGGVRARAAGARRAADALAMAALTAVRLVGLCFGVGAYYTAEGLGVFAAVNLLAGAAALGVSALLALRRGGARRVHGAGGLADLGWVLAALVVAVGAERALDRTG